MGNEFFFPFLFIGMIFEIKMCKWVLIFPKKKIKLHLRIAINQMHLLTKMNEFYENKKQLC